MTRALRLALTALSFVAVTGCGTPRPPESPPSESQSPVPSPTVSATEVQQRLAEHLRRFGHSVFEPEAHVTPPIATTSTGCPGGPAWGVVPRAESTVSAAAPPKRQLQDLVNWLLRNDFDQDIDVHSKVPPDIDRTLVHPDGSRLHLTLPQGNPPLTMVLTGPCSWPADRQGGPPAGALKPLRGESGPMTAGGNEVCSSPRNYVYNRDAPPFTGPGPHPITLVDLDRTVGSDGISGPKHSGYPLLPGWEPRRAGSVDVDTTKVQLIACVQADEVPTGDKKVTCRFDNGPVTFDLVESTYRVTVREARTGNQLADLTLRGTQSDAQSCPTVVTYYKNITPRLLRGIDIAGFRDPLRPLIEGSR